VFQHYQPWNSTAPAYGRFWIDTPDGRRRKVISLGVCRTPSIAKQRLREYIESNGVNTKQAFAASTGPATTFRQQAERWLSYMATRRRKPVKPATVSRWRYSLNKWLLPNLGNMPLADIGNAALKSVVEEMAAAELAPQSIVSIAQVVKMVVASAVNDEGEQVHPRKWNHDFCGIPIVDPTKQRRPTLTAERVSAIVCNAGERYRALFALLAGTGLRIGEALALKVADLAPDCRTIQVQRSVWHGQEQAPKTPNAVRSIDVPEVLAALLQEYARGKAGYLFATASGRPLSQRNVLRTLHGLAGKVGFHAFRRFRTETLRRARVPEDLVRLWLGHAERSVTDAYANGLREDLVWRREWCERVGLGFQLGYNGLQNVVQTDSVKVA